MKVLLAVSIIIFWLSFPFGVILMSSQLEVTTLDTTYYSEINEPNDFNIFTSIWEFIKIYFTAMFMIIPNSTGIWTMFTIIMQVISALVVYLLLREG